MAGWSDLMMRHVDTLLDGMDRDAILARYGWVEEYAGRAGEALSPESLAGTPPEKIYRTLDSIRLPKVQVRMTNLGRMNQAEDVVAGIAALLSEPGDFARKYRAGKIPQAGVVALSQILTLARPDRFAIRNAPFTRALAKLIPLYTAKALDELGYEEYLDMCRELARVAVLAFKNRGLGEWAERYRFLLLYALLVGE
jgi:hypothetical protein